MKRYVLLFILSVFISIAEAQFLNDITIKFGPTLNSLVYFESSAPALYKNKMRSPFFSNSPSFSTSLGTTLLYTKRINLELTTYYITKRQNSFTGDMYVDPINKVATLSYMAVSLPVKIKLKKNGSTKKTRYYVSLAPRIEYQISKKNSTKVAYDTTNKVIPGITLAPGVEWKKENNSIGVELFYTQDLIRVFNYYPFYPEHVGGRHNTIGVNFVYRHYFIKSKDYYNKYY